MSAILKSDLLDVREGQIPGVIQCSVRIPLSELRDRIGELPPKAQRVRVAATGPEAQNAVAFLLQGGRIALLEPHFELGEDNPREYRLWEPNEFLMKVLPDLTPGVALDLACGVGREAVTMATSGWRVIAIDHLPDAVERAKRLANAYQAADQVTWLCEDVSQFDFAQLGPVNLVTMFFFLDHEALGAAGRILEPGGSLVVETFTKTHQARFGKPADDRLILGEIDSITHGLEVVQFTEEWRSNGRHTARLWARRQAKD